MVTFHILTIFPNIFSSYFNESILKRAQEKKLIKIKIYNIRDFTKDKHKTAAPAFATPASNALRLARNAFAYAMRAGSNAGWRKRCGRVDDKPYGGGPGMVLKIEPIVKAIGSAISNAKFLISKKIPKPKLQKVKIILFSPRGKQFTQAMARNLAKRYQNIILICGHYEGIDARLKKVLQDSGFKFQEVSVGPYILSGGEAGAMVLVDTISRQIPGVLGKIESLEEKKGSYPVYTRPEFIFKNKPACNALRSNAGRKYGVPKVLLSGNHKKISQWRLKRGKMV